MIYLAENENRSYSGIHNSSLVYRGWNLQQVHYIFRKWTRLHYVTSFSRLCAMKSRSSRVMPYRWAKFIQFYYMKWVWQDWFCHILKFPSPWQQKDFLSLRGGKLVGWCSRIDYFAIQIISMSQEITLQCLDFDSLVTEHSHHFVPFQSIFDGTYVEHLTQVKHFQN